MNKIIATILGLAMTTSVFAHDISAYAYNVTGIAGYSVPISSVHVARLINNQNTPMTYMVSVSLSADGARGQSRTDNITVPAHSEYTYKNELGFSQTYNYQGNYNIIAITHVVGDGGERHEHHATAFVR